MTDRSTLKRVLTHIGQVTAELGSDGGGRILVLEHGARVLGLFPPDNDENLLWTNPALEKTDTASELFAAASWQNTGGDRTWLAPERELFIKDLKRVWQTYRVPAALDPGKFQLRRTRDGVKLTGHATLSLFQSGQTAHARITKIIEPTPNPLRHERALAGQVRFVGYAVRASLNCKARLGLWQLLQLPHSGEMIVPTFGRTQPVVLFGKVPRRDLHVMDGVVRHAMRARGDHKLGIRAVACTGRAGYLYRVPRGQAVLVVRQWTVDLSGDYVDTPWHDPSDRGWCFQICNVNSEIGRFSEMEYHAPAGMREDCSQVWAFRGSRSAINQVARTLLGV